MPASRHTRAILIAFAMLVGAATAVVAAPLGKRGGNAL